MRNLEMIDGNKNEQNNTQTQRHMHTPQKHCTISGCAKLSRKYCYIGLRCNNLPQVVYWCNNLPRPWGKLLQLFEFAYYVISLKCLVGFNFFLLILIR